MSYSFSVSAPDKEAAKAAVAAKFDEVVAAQTCHKHDRGQALAAAGAMIDLLSDEPGKTVVVAVAGYLSGVWEGSDVTRISAASVSTSASLV